MKKLWLDLQRAQPAVVELVEGTLPPTYRIWLAYKKDFSAGTYVELTPDGKAIRMTIDEDGTINSTKEIW